MVFRKIFPVLVIAAFLVQACHDRQQSFKLLTSGKTGITFNNTITESDSFNVLLFEYIYNGGGVGVGDVNNDGLQDIFFAGNMVSSRLYLNEGDFNFKDVTTEANVTTSLWCTGVAMIDINQDGLLDVHVSTINPDKNGSSPNLLFLNKGPGENGVPVFEEVAAKIGIADSSYSTQAVFLDYDRDGDLDLYLANNALETFNRNIPVGQREDGGGKSVDKFYRNEGTGADGLPVFKDVSREAGVLAEGWGLGVVANDFNRDGYPDVYVANDFLSTDHLYINNRNGTFSNEVARCMKHEEYNGMGIDVADINNDGLNDIAVMDMMPDDNLRQKTMFSSVGYDKFQLNLKQKYQPQYVRNVLQLNNGNGTFSDIGYLAGVNATDWSWSALFADFDNDGYRDLLITNGYRKDVTDLDFAAYSKEASRFGTTKTRLKSAVEAIEKLEGVKKPNFLFRNNGDLTFSNKAPEWGLDQPSYSNGAAYADFDNDGDLDLVMNNINDEAFVYRNDLERTERTPANFLRVKLKGAKGNLEGIGATLSLYHEGKLLYAEHQLQRGYKSAVEPIEHFGLGNSAAIDSLVITWQSGKSQVLKNVKVNQVIVLEEKNAVLRSHQRRQQQSLFNEVHTSYSVYHRQTENEFVDYKQGQPLLPQKHSQLGAGVAVGDMNGDGLEDFVIGGAANKRATVFYQQANATFRVDSLPSKSQEDMGMLLFDTDHDGDLDLYCVSGSTEFGSGTRSYQDRLYRNSGPEVFVLDTTALPVIKSSGSCVTACDVDQDGDLDLFVGGRISPARYPEPPQSYLLRNNGAGVFEDITAQVGGLQTVGMVTSALWTDFDNDHWTDLIVVGEWMPITFFRNRNGTLEKIQPQSPTAESTVGWWNSINGGDFDNDGDTDYIAGNVGLNSLYKASEKEPVCLYAKDYDENGSIDPVLCRYIQGKEYITHPRETLTDQLVSMRRVFQRYAIYGKSTFQDVFPAKKLEGAMIYKGTWFATTYIENTGDGNFKLKALPVETQLSPVFGMTIADVNSDGNLDVLTVGNSYSSEPLTGFYDAGIGACLLGDGKGNFTAMTVSQSGFFADRDAKALASLALPDNSILWIATANQDSTKIFERNGHVASAIMTPGDTDVSAEILFKDGRKQKAEFYYGAGYLSQSTRKLSIPEGVAEVIIYNSKGTSRKVRVTDRPAGKKKIKGSV